MPRLLLLALLALPLAACDSNDDVFRQTATADLSAPDDTTTDVTGEARLIQEDDVLRVDMIVGGLEANSVHGFHIHETGSCARGDHDDDGFEEVGGAAGGHYDPYETDDHGAPRDDIDDKHAGDFGNITANANGVARVAFVTDEISLSGTRPVQNRAIVIHADRDDLETDPGGNSGDRIACGVISEAVDVQ